MAQNIIDTCLVFKSLFAEHIKLQYLLTMAISAPSLDSILAIPFPSPVPPPVRYTVFPLKVSGGNMAPFTTFRLSYFSDGLSVCTHVVVERLLREICSRNVQKIKNNLGS